MSVKAFVWTMLALQALGLAQQLIALGSEGLKPAQSLSRPVRAWSVLIHCALVMWAVWLLWHE